MKNRNAIQEIKALDYVVKTLYVEKDYLISQIEKYNSEKTKIQLQVIEHFINLYEGY